MDKYGAHTPERADTCPECGQTVQRNGAVQRCPTHGTKPFETSTSGVDSVGTGEDTTKPE